MKPIESFAPFRDTEKALAIDKAITAAIAVQTQVQRLPTLKAELADRVEEVERLEVSAIFEDQPDLAQLRARVAALQEMAKKIEDEGERTAARLELLHRLRSQAEADYRAQMAPLVLAQMQRLLEEEYLPALARCADAGGRLNAAALEAKKFNLPCCALFPGLSWSRGRDDWTGLTHFSRLIKQHFGVDFDVVKPERAATIAIEMQHSIVQDEQQRAAGPAQQAQRAAESAVGTVRGILVDLEGRLRAAFGWGT